MRAREAVKVLTYALASGLALSILGPSLSCLAFTVPTTGPYRTSLQSTIFPTTQQHPDRRKCLNTSVLGSPLHRPVAFHAVDKRQDRVRPQLLATAKSADGGEQNDDGKGGSILPFALLTLGGALYWYWMVFGALAKVQGLPGIPDWLPMVPGWPPSTEDLQGPLDDSVHFFYLSELLQKTDAPLVPLPRLAVFNLVEAWMFAMLPALWADPKRAPRPVLLGLWGILGINLTNAFLLPYLAFTSLTDSDDVDLVEGISRRNPFASAAFGIIASLVALYALYSSVTETTLTDWSDFWKSCQADRTYLAFCVDCCVFTLVQPYLLRRISPGKDKEQAPTDVIPFVGLMIWLFTSEKESETEVA